MSADSCCRSLHFDLLSYQVGTVEKLTLLWQIQGILEIPVVSVSGRGQDMEKKQILPFGAVEVLTRKTQSHYGEESFIVHSNFEGFVFLYNVLVCQSIPIYIIRFSTWVDGCGSSHSMCETSLP